MSTDYSKLKNVELEALLKERSLPHTGKKAEMVQRLKDDDAKKGGSGQDSKATDNDEDQIDWDDDIDNAAPATAGQPIDAKDIIDWDDDAPPAAETKEATSVSNGQVSNPAATSNGDVAKDDATAGEANNTNDAKDAAAPAIDGGDKAEPEPEPTSTFTAGLDSVTEEEERKKREIRAKRWESDFKKSGRYDEIQEKAKRELRFGSTGGISKMLNGALSEEKPRKRGREGKEDGRRGDFKRGGGRGGFRGGRDGQSGRGGSRGRGGQVEKQESRPKPAAEGDWMSEKDRAAAKAREGKFLGKTLPQE
jgi:SAP domain-containing ribonucleoprotein